MGGGHHRFFGTVRMGEILASTERSFSPASDLLWQDVRCSSENSLLIHLKNPKSGMPGGEKVDLFEFFRVMTAALSKH
jgi:hypothetical protein